MIICRINPHGIDSAANLELLCETCYFENKSRTGYEIKAERVPEATKRFVFFLLQIGSANASKHSATMKMCKNED